jgi:hypothetical protein
MTRLPLLHFLAHLHIQEMKVGKIDQSVLLPPLIFLLPQLLLFHPLLFLQLLAQMNQR